MDQDIFEKIKNAKASWETDGLGVMGKRLSFARDPDSASSRTPCRITNTQSSSTLDEFPVSAGGGVGEGVASTSYPDFSLYPAGPSTVGVKSGTVGGMLPTGMSSGGVPEFTISVSGDGLLYLEATVDETTSDLTAVVILAGSSSPADTSTKAYRVIGGYSVNDDGIVSIGYGTVGIGSQNFVSCGGFHYYFS